MSNKEKNNFYKNRPTFYYTGRNGYVSRIKGSGILFYVIDIENNVKWLMTNISGVYSDIGGKTSREDLSPLDTAIRHTLIKTNNSLFVKGESKYCCFDKLKRIIINYNKEIVSRLYSKKSKYLIHFLRLPYHFYRININRFVKKNEVNPFIWVDNLYLLNLHIRISLIKSKKKYVSTMLIHNIQSKNRVDNFHQKHNTKKYNKIKIYKDEKKEKTKEFVKPREKRTNTYIKHKEKRPKEFVKPEKKRTNTFVKPEKKYTTEDLINSMLNSLSL